MDNLRSLIQAKLEEIQDLEVSAEVPDELIEIGKTYFSFNLQRTYNNSDFERNFTYQVSLDGFIKRKNIEDENTLKIIDDMQDKIEQKLKEINMTTNFQDVSVLDAIKKARVSGYVKYNEINKGLI